MLYKQRDKNRIYPTYARVLLVGHLFNRLQFALVITRHDQTCLLTMCNEVAMQLRFTSQSLATEWRNLLKIHEILNNKMGENEFSGATIFVEKTLIAFLHFK